MPDHQQSQGSGQRLLPSVGEGREVLPLTLVPVLLPALAAEGEGGGPHLRRRNRRPPLLHGVLTKPQPLPPPAPLLGCQPLGTAYDAGGARAQQQCR